MEIIDISPPLSAATPVWPGDRPLKRQVAMALDAGDHFELSALETTVHIGAHADAPSHYVQGATIDEVELGPYIGKCYVKTCLNVPLIYPQHCPEIEILKCQRILFRTLTFSHLEPFSKEFSAFAPETMRYLGEHGVKLIGIDTPSVDAFDSKDLASHHAMFAAGIRNLEGLNLDAVEDGFYELIALPLRLVGFDASPVRAILRY